MILRYERVTLVSQFIDQHVLGFGFCLFLLNHDVLLKRWIDLTSLILVRAFLSVHFNTLTSVSSVFTHLSCMLASDFTDNASDDFRFLVRSIVFLALSELHFSSSITSKLENFLIWVSPDHFYYLCGLNATMEAVRMGTTGIAIRQPVSITVSILLACDPESTWSTPLPGKLIPPEGG